MCAGLYKMCERTGVSHSGICAAPYECTLLPLLSCMAAGHSKASLMRANASASPCTPMPIGRWRKFEFFACERCHGCGVYFNGMEWNDGETGWIGMESGM